MANQLAKKESANADNRGGQKKKRLLCRLGLHQWDYSPAVYKTAIEELLALPSLG